MDPDWLRQGSGVEFERTRRGVEKKSLTVRPRWIDVKRTLRVILEKVEVTLELCLEY